MTSSAIYPTEISTRKSHLAFGLAGSMLTSAAIILILTEHLSLALITLAAVGFFAFLMTAPPFSLAFFLILFIPFEGLITASLGGLGSSSRQWFAMWKEVLWAVGIFRVLWNNPNRKTIMASNRVVLVWSGLLILAYCVTFLRMPSVAAIFSFDLETRFLGVMLFFMFLDLDGKRIALLLRAMVWSAGLIALYGLIQYFWDYERLLPLLFSTSEVTADDTHRLYSYSLSIFDAAYGPVIAILILFAGAGRIALRFALPLYALLVPCLFLTYTRSGYLGLLAGILMVCIIDRAHMRRHALVIAFTLSLCCATMLVGGASLRNSDLGQRLQSIVSQTDGSSVAHKESLKRAVDSISTNPFGIGLGRNGIIEAVFAGDVDQSMMTENWTLQVAVQTGLPGAIASLGLTVAIIISLLRVRYYRNEDVSALRVAAAAAFVAMTTVGMMIPVWDHLLTSVYAWTLVGMGLGTARAPRTGRSTAAVSSLV